MDHSITVEPGSEFPVQAGGDFVFCKFADRDIRVIIQNSPRTMRAGSKWRPAGGFEAGDVIVQNPDPVNPVAVVLTIGVGDFDDQIIRGEVTVNPGIRGRDGVFIDDTRSTVRLSAAFGNITPREYVEGDEIAVVDSPGMAVHPTVLSDGRVLVCDEDGNDWAEWNWQSGTRRELPNLAHGPGVQVGPELFLPLGDDVPGSGRRIVLLVYDAATLTLRRRITTGAQWNGYASAPGVRGVEALPGGRFAISHDNGGSTPGNRGVSIVDGKGEVVKLIDGFSAAVIVRNGVMHVYEYYIRDADARFFDAVTLEELTEERSEIPVLGPYVRGAAITVYDTLIVGFNVPHNDNVAEFAINDVVISASGTVSACAGSGRFKAGQVDTIAELYTQRLENGRVLASGQLLRAVLEIYAGRYMPSDYLDYIYAVKADNLNGISPRVIDAGGQSFAAAGIADDAAGTFPQTIEITLREGLL